jgi:ATP-dependent DNA helicase RecQ
MATPHDLLRDTFGLEAFRPGQEAVIGHLLSGKSAAAVFPTGGGKSLCYQLPALLLSGVTLVVSPLIALMKEQIDRLKARGLPAERLDSTLDAEDVRRVMNDLRGNRLRLLYVAPERFNNERLREALLRLRVSLFAVDEAHCISEWGHNFRPDYLKLARFARLCKAERTLALTATATPQVLADICQGFGIPSECAVRTGFHRPNLTLHVTPVAAAERDVLLSRRLTEPSHGPSIVYVTLQRTAEEVAGRLFAAGVPAKFYHAGMDDAHRAAVQDWFAASDEAVVVATIAFGMGIDKANIHTIYHYNLPKSLENYSQEIGRAGRDGLPSVCELFLCPDDLNRLENFIYGDTPTLDAVRGLVRDLFAQGEDFAVSLSDLSNEHDIRPLVVSTLLTYLELDGYLEGGTPYYANYAFQPLAPSADILAKFDSERRQFLTTVFRQAQKAKTWFHIDLDAAARATRSPRERVMRALDYLSEQGLMMVKADGLRHRYRRLRMPQDVEAVADDLHRRTQERESRELARLHQVVDLAGHDGCQVSHLGAHFGEPLAEPCGRCSWCSNGRQPARLLPRSQPVIDDEVWRQAMALRRQHGDLLREPRALARLLCGLGSPRLSRNKLTSVPLFGALDYVPFPEVLRRAEGMLREIR